MNSETTKATSRTVLPGVVALLLLVPGIALSQVPVDEDGVPLQTLDGEIAGDSEALAQASKLSAGELEELAGPVALYPDDLLAIVLPASTYPLEIVQAARFLEQLESDDSLEPDESWDESVTALLNYPEVVRMMDEDIDWTWRLGEAVIAQQEELIAAIEAFRDRAYAAGNLKSDEYQEVSNDDGVIEIVPVDEEIIYVPYYEPKEVVVYQPRQVYYYYPRAYPVYYYPYPVGHHFSSGSFWGVTTAFSIGWNNRYLHVYHPSYWGHPYYGRSYYSHYYRRPSLNVYNNWYVNNSYRTSRYRYRDGDYWRPRHRSGARPQDQRVRNHHYPSRNRNDARNAGDRMRVRNNGRMDLGLRERNRSIANGNRTAAENRARSQRSSSEQRRNRNDRTVADRQTRQRQTGLNNANRIRVQRSENSSDNINRRSASDRSGINGPGIRFRNRQNTDNGRADRQAGSERRAPSSNDAARRAASQRAVVQRQRTQVGSQRRAPSSNDAARRATPQRAVVQRQRTQVGSARSAPATRPPAAATRGRAPARQPVQRATGRGESTAAQGRRESSSRKTTVRQRKRK